MCVHACGGVCANMYGGVCMHYVWGFVCECVCMYVWVGVYACMNVWTVCVCDGGDGN